MEFGPEHSEREECIVFAESQSESLMFDINQKEK